MQSLGFVKSNFQNNFGKCNVNYALHPKNDGRFLKLMENEAVIVAGYY